MSRVALEGFRKRALCLPRRTKRAILMATDFCLFSLALWLALSLRFWVLYSPPNYAFGFALAMAPLIGVTTFHFLKLYKRVTRFIGQSDFLRIYAGVTLAVLFWLLFMFMSQAPGVLPRSSVVIYWALSGLFIWSSRQMAAWVLLTEDHQGSRRGGEEGVRSVLIYGAGETGVRLAEALSRRRDYRVLGFLDDNRNLWRQYVAGYKVYPLEKLASFVARGAVKEILLAIPSLSRQKRKEILSRLEPFAVSVRILPAMADIASGRVSVSDLRPVDPVDLLGRDPVPPDPQLISRNVCGKSVMITGAGGSIGSELARQILALGPRRLVLFEMSEAALYEIEMELRDAQKAEREKAARKAAAWPGVEIVTVLGSVLDGDLLRQVMETHGVETIYHAAAYKHVPMVERNPVAGLRNNTFGTIEAAVAAMEANVGRFVLISTDKAVRPTNIMGASKRLAELALQAMSLEEESNTIFTMVRFGNVLGSSGSVVQRFRKQIETGGPVTVTHRDVIRYFMSIPEAAQLVIQAGAMAKGGELFVLDMGEPVKIDDLARAMIRLVGLEVRDESNPNGDIAIEYIGLREGEKLYEELLIGENVSRTEHPRILRVSEPVIPGERLREELDNLAQYMEDNDLVGIVSVLSKLVEGYHPVAHGKDDVVLSGNTLETGSRTLH